MIANAVHFWHPHLKDSDMRKLFMIPILFAVDLFSQWTPIPAGVNMELGGVLVDDALTYWVGGMNGVLLKTTDGGENWETEVLIGAGDLGQLIRLDDNTLIMLADDDLVARSTNNGDDWELISTGAPNVLYDMTHVGDLIWASGRDGSIVHSTDGGQTWATQISGTTERLHGIDALNATTLMVVGRDGVVLRTTNGGQTWEPVTSPVEDDLSSIMFLDDAQQTGLLAGPPAEIFRSIDNGNNWTSVAYSSILEIGAFASEDPDVVYAVGDGGLILRSIDQGQNWDVMTSGVTTELSAIDVKDGVAVAVGAEGTIIKLAPGTIEIAEITGVGTMNVHPNPSKGPVTIQWLNESATDGAILEILTTDGRLVDRTNWPIGKRSAHVEELQPGSYVVRMTSSSGLNVQRTLIVTAH